MAKNEKFKPDGFDQYGRPKTKMNAIDAYFLNNVKYGAGKGYYAPLDLPLSLFGETKLENGPLYRDEKASRSKLNAAAKEKGKYMKSALAKAAQKAKPAEPTSPPPRSKNPAPKPPVTKAPPKPGKPDYKTKDVPMPNKSKTKKYPSRGM